MNLDLAAARSLKEAALLRFAADLIRRGGYNPRPADGDPGYSLSSALCAVTGCDPGARHIPDCEDLHRRVAGYLYLTGRAWSRESLPCRPSSRTGRITGRGRGGAPRPRRLTSSTTRAPC